VPFRYALFSFAVGANEKAQGKSWRKTLRRNRRRGRTLSWGEGGAVKFANGGGHTRRDISVSSLKEASRFRGAKPGKAAGTAAFSGHSRFAQPVTARRRHLREAQEAKRVSSTER